MGLLKAAFSGIGRMFMRKVTTVDAAGDENTRRQTTPFGKASAVVLGLALFYHFIAWPVLTYHWPEYGFPPIDSALLSVLASLGM